MKSMLILLAVLFYQPRGGWSLFGGCPVETCMQEHEMYSLDFPQSNNTFVCGVVMRAMVCLDNHGCSGFSVQIQRAILEDQYNDYMCDSVPTPTPIMDPTPDVTLPTSDPTPDPTTPCSVETCMQEYNMYRLVFPQLNNTFVCGVVMRAMDCLDNHGCSGFSVQLQRAYLGDQYNEYMCVSVPAPTPTPDVTSPSMTPLNCSMDALPCDSPLGDCCPGIPSLPDSCNPIIYLRNGSTQPEAVQGECNKIPISGEMQHCSMFTYSHIRPFGAYGDNIQTCALPGSWYLIKHANFSIEVESESERVDSPHTRLTKVNVTFFDGKCSERQSYVAYSANPLPYSFTGGFFPFNTGSPLQLNVTSDGTVASLLATWLNMSVIIRNHFGYLSVTVQVPGRLIFDTEGLCNGGCPHHTYLGTEQLRNEEIIKCSEDYNSIVIHCFKGLSNKDGLLRFTNTSYAYLCVFDILKTHNLHMLSMSVAVSNDALLLPDVGFVVIPPTTSPPTFIEPPTETITDVEQPEPTASREQAEPTSSIPLETTSPSDGTLDTVSPQVSLHSSLHVLTVLVTVSIALALR